VRKPSASQISHWFEIGSAGNLTTFTAKTDSYTEALRGYLGGSLDFDLLIQRLSLLKAAGAYGGSFRFVLSENSGFDYYFLHDDCVVIIAREIGAEYKNADSFRIANCCSLRIRLQGDLLEHFEDYDREVHQADCSFFNFGDGFDFYAGVVGGQRVNSIVIYFKPEGVLRGLHPREQPILSLIADTHCEDTASAHLIPFDMNGEILALSNRLFNLRDEQALLPMMVESYSLELLASCLIKLEAEQASSTHQPRLRKSELEQLDALRKLIEEDFSADFNLDQISRRVGMNRRKLNESFKAVYGSTIHEHLLARRMNHATQALRAGKTVLETALEVGYSNPRSFGLAFKRYFGVTPAKYH